METMISQVYDKKDAALYLLKVNYATQLELMELLKSNDFNIIYLNLDDIKNKKFKFVINDEINYEQSVTNVGKLNVNFNNNNLQNNHLNNNSYDKLINVDIINNSIQNGFEKLNDKVNDLDYVEDIGIEGEKILNDKNLNSQVNHSPFFNPFNTDGTLDLPQKVNSSLSDVQETKLENSDGGTRYNFTYSNGIEGVVLLPKDCKKSDNIVLFYSGDSYIYSDSYSLFGENNPPYPTLAISRAQDNGGMEIDGIKNNGKF